MSEETVLCTFCGKSEDDVKMMISSPLKEQGSEIVAAANICSDCIALYAQIVTQSDD